MTFKHVQMLITHINANLRIPKMISPMRFLCVRASIVLSLLDVLISKLRLCRELKNPGQN